MENKKTINPIDLLAHFKSYMEHVGLKDVGPIQFSETRKAFMAGCGVTLLVLRDYVADLEEEEAIKAMENMMEQARTVAKTE